MNPRNPNFLRPTDDGLDKSNPTVEAIKDILKGGPSDLIKGMDEALDLDEDELKDEDEDECRDADEVAMSSAERKAHRKRKDPSNINAAQKMMKSIIRGGPTGDAADMFKGKRAPLDTNYAGVAGLKKDLSGTPGLIHQSAFAKYDPAAVQRICAAGRAADLAKLGLQFRKAVNQFQSRPSVPPGSSNSTWDNTTANDGASLDSPRIPVPSQSTTPVGGHTDHPANRGPIAAAMSAKDAEVAAVKRDLSWSRRKQALAAAAVKDNYGAT